MSLVNKALFSEFRYELTWRVKAILLPHDSSNVLRRDWYVKEMEDYFDTKSKQQERKGK